MNDSIPILLKALWCHITPRRHKQFILLLAMMLLASILEIFSISSVLPFLGVLVAPQNVFETPIFQPIIQIFSLTEPKQLLLPLTIIFSVAVLISSVLRIFLLWVMTRLSFAVGADLSIRIYRLTLYQPYSVHCGRNSSEIISGITAKTNGVIYNIIVPALMFVSSSIMLLIILIGLLIVEPLISLLAFSGFGIIYIAVIFVTREQLLRDSKCVARESTQVIKSLQEGLGGIRDVLIDGSQEIYCGIYQNSDSQLRRAQGSSLFIGASPRFGMEALGMILIAALAYFLAIQDDGLAKSIPILGFLALGAQRLLPVLQQAYGSLAQIKSGQISLKDTLALLDQKLPNYVNDSLITLPFHESIKLKHIGFSYSGRAPNVLSQINLSITKGSKVGFIGTTGSGKSTLLDIIMGLLQPTTGALEIDGIAITSTNFRSWQSHIAHVPQTIFLSDSSIEENIAFGIPRELIDRSRVRLAAQKAQISDTIESWPLKYETFVGERGIRLSGGQRQRIGIARALYKEADVIVLDEATSSLDNATELSVMEVIGKLDPNLTLLIVAHRLTTLKNCTQLVELSNGVIRRSGTYQDIIN